MDRGINGKNKIWEGNVDGKFLALHSVVVGCCMAIANIALQ